MNDWKVVRGMLKALGLPVHLYGSYAANRGKLSKFGSLLLSAAWQVHFKHNCMVLLDDDVQLPDDFEHSFNHLSMQWHGQEVLQFGQWGEGYVFNLKAASEFVESTFQAGICLPSDVLIIGRLLPTYIDKINSTLLVQTNNGSIAKSSKITSSEFSYPMKPWRDAMQIMSNAFSDEHEINLVAIARRIASS